VSPADVLGPGEADRMIHEPSRRVILTVLNTVQTADFLFLLRETGLSKGNLSAHLSKLEGAGYVAIEKTFRGKIPLTMCRLTDVGRTAFRGYREYLEQVVASMTGPGQPRRATPGSDDHVEVGGDVRPGRQRD
jgi:DNA-binding transcriptional ArsR family regulator